MLCAQPRALVGFLPPSSSSCESQAAPAAAGTEKKQSCCPQHPRREAGTPVPGGSPWGPSARWVFGCRRGARRSRSTAWSGWMWQMESDQGSHQGTVGPWDGLGGGAQGVTGGPTQPQPRSVSPDCKTATKPLREHSPKWQPGEKPFLLLGSLELSQKSSASPSNDARPQQEPSSHGLLRGRAPGPMGTVTSCWAPRCHRPAASAPRYPSPGQGPRGGIELALLHGFSYPGFSQP